MTADAGKDGRDVAALQARISEALAQLARTDAELVKVQGKVDSLTGRIAALESDQPSEKPTPEVPECTDPNMPSEAEIAVMRKRLKARNKAGMEAHRADPGYAGRTYTGKDSG